MNRHTGHESPISNTWTCVTEKAGGFPKKIRFMHKASEFTAQKKVWGNKKYLVKIIAIILLD